jgi:hypothetical protein
MGDKLDVDLSESLYRRSFLNPLKKFMNLDGSATSRVFKLRGKDKGELSTDVKSLTTPEKSIGDINKHLLFEIEVAKVVLIGLTAKHDPVEDNPAHSFIWGMNEEDDIFPGLLARKSKRVIV